MFGSVTSVLAPKGLWKDHRVSYSHSKKTGLQCLGGMLRSLSLLLIYTCKHLYCSYSSHQSKRIGKMDQHFHLSLSPHPGSWMQRRRKDLSFSCSGSVHWPFGISAVIMRNISCHRVFYKFLPPVLVQGWRSYSYFFHCRLNFWNVILSHHYFSAHEVCMKEELSKCLA